MTHQPRSRNRARRDTRLLQAASGVLALGAVGVVAVGLPWLSVPTAESVAVKPVANTTGAAGDPAGDSDLTPFRVDPEGLSARMSLVDNAPEAPEVDDGPEIDDPPVVTAQNPTTNEQPGAVEFAYLGAISEPSRRVALISVDGRQSFLGVGDTSPAGAGEFEVLEVTPGAVKIEFEGETRTVEKKKRTQLAVTMVSGGEINTIDLPEGEADGDASRRGGRTTDLSNMPLGNRNMPEHVRRRREEMQTAAAEGRLREYNQERIRNAENQELLRKPVTAPSLSTSPNRRNGDGGRD